MLWSSLLLLEVQLEAQLEAHQDKLELIQYTLDSQDRISHQFPKYHEWYATLGIAELHSHPYKERSIFSLINISNCR